MTQSPLINLGELSKPATVLIEKVSEAVGGVFKPMQIRRVAQADADAQKIKAIAQIEISEIQQRAIQRLIVEESRNQANIEEITAKAIPQLEEDSQPGELDEDWIANFFDRGRLISNEEMQVIWSRVLAGEANYPGSFSKRTVNLLGSLSREDALLFQFLSGFLLKINYGSGSVHAFVYNTDEEIYKNEGVNFGVLKHLDNIGLISFGNLTGYRMMELPENVTAEYFDTKLQIGFNKKESNNLDIGKVLLSQIGQELAPICGAKPVPEFLNYLIEHWVRKFGFDVSSPLSVDE